MQGLRKSRSCCPRRTSCSRWECCRSRSRGQDRTNTLSRTEYRHMGSRRLCKHPSKPQWSCSSRSTCSEDKTRPCPWASCRSNNQGMHSRRYRSCPGRGRWYPDRWRFCCFLRRFEICYRNSQRCTETRPPEGPEWRYRRSRCRSTPVRRNGSRCLCK